MIGLVRRLPWVHRLFHRTPDRACLICRYVWWRLLREPGLRQSLDRGIADLDAGRTVPWVHEIFTPDVDGRIIGRDEF